MEGRTLKRLAEVGEMAKLDLSPGAVTLAPIEGGVLSWYSGVSAAGGVEAQVYDVLERPVSVYSTEFKDMAALFADEAQVALKPEATALVLSSGKRRVSLRYLNQPDIAVYQQIRDPGASFLSVKRDALLREIGFASSVSAVTMNNPILTGIRITGNRTAMAIQAINGSSLVFQSAIPVESSEPLEIVGPTSDLLLALRLLGDEEAIGFHMSGRSMILQGSNGIVKLSTLQGNWPSHMVDALKKLEFTESVSIPASVLRDIATAVRAYKATNEVVIRPANAGHVRIETRESELGQFQEAIPGTLAKPYVFDVADLETVSKISSEEIVLQFAPTMAMTKIGTRRLYVLCRVDK